MTKKSWKDNLLSSGLPLEQSVIVILEKLGIDKPSEYTYERNNELGVPTVFSIDVYASQIFDNPTTQIFLDVFCECKYRHDSVRWIFTPEEFGRWPRPKFSDTFVTLDQLTDDYVIDADYLNQFSDKYDLCGKGIEITEDDTNPKSIEQCLQQLRYGVINQVQDDLIHQIDNLLGYPTPIFVLVPIVVTTAQLWRIHPTTTIQKIREAKDLPEVAKKLDFLIVSERPDNLSTKYTHSKLNDGFTSGQKAKFESHLKSHSTLGFKLFLNTFSSKSPSLFVFVNYSHFESAMKNLLSFFASGDLIKLRTKNPKS